MAQEKAFIVKLESGEEIGPLDQEALVKQTENGTITAGAQVRSTLLPLWMKAGEVDCLKKMLREQQHHLAVAAAQTRRARLKARMELRGDYDPLSTALSQEGLTYHKPAFLLRLLAALFDLFIIGLAALAILLLILLMQNFGLFPKGVAAFYCYAAAVWITAAMYYMYNLNRNGQTRGQHFWGLVTVTRDLTPVYLGRGAGFFLLLVLLGWLSPAAYLLTGCKHTLHELCTGLRVKRIVVARKRY